MNVLLQLCSSILINYNCKPNQTLGTEVLTVLKIVSIQKMNQKAFFVQTLQDSSNFFFFIR